MIALPDVAHVDAEKLSDVAAIEKWMARFPDLNEMPIEEAMEFLDITLSEELYKYETCLMLANVCVRRNALPFLCIVGSES